MKRYTVADDMQRIITGTSSVKVYRDEAGPFVMYEDAAALEAKVERLKSALVGIRDLDSVRHDEAFVIARDALKEVK